MATPTYDLIASQVLSTSASSVSFSSIPATYRDLVLVVDAIGDIATSLDIWARVNSDTGANYSMVRMSGDGSSATSGTTTQSYYNLTMGPVYLTSAHRTMVKAEFLDYSATDKHKALLVRANEDGGVSAIAQRWANTSAISSIEVRTSTNNFDASTSFYLYGISS